MGELPVVGALTMATDLTQQKALEEQRIMQACLKERAMIAMDLHDNTLQALHGTVLALAAAERTAGCDAEHLRDAIRQVRQQLNDAIKELRGYLLYLRPWDPHDRKLSGGLALLGEQARLCAELGVIVTVDQTAEVIIGQMGVGNQLLAIAREATSNVMRHAKARVLVIRVWHVDGRCKLLVSDNGRGFNPHAIASSAGQGLTNMSERARLIGAELCVVSRPGAGTQVRLELPPTRRPDDV